MILRYFLGPAIKKVLSIFYALEDEKLVKLPKVSSFVSISMDARLYYLLSSYCFYDAYFTLSTRHKKIRLRQHAVSTRTFVNQ